ncbi:uncharacterized protein METZ01_LOCUS385692, partial [marine metagenome]
MKIKNFNLGLGGFLSKNPKLGNFLPQAVTLFAIIFIIGFFTFNAQTNMDTRGIDFGFGFLTQESSFDIQFSLIDYDGSYSYARAYLVGLLNTLLVSAIGIFFATVLGVIVGISRLSSNYLIAKLAEVYVEIFRNIPLLLQIFFWYFAALRALPLPKEAVSFFDVSFLTIKGFFIPKFVWTNFSVLFYSFVAAVVSIVFVYVYGKRKQESTGERIPIFFISAGLLIILPLIATLLGGVNLDFE